MSPFWLISHLVLWLLVLVLGFLLFGALRALGVLKWRLEQLEATTPGRIGRNGLRPGKKAPDFCLPSVAGPDIALHDFASRNILLVFTQTGCGPCHKIMPELNRLNSREAQVIVINNGQPDQTRRWANQLDVGFPVLIQEHFQVSRQYEIFATPFAFLIDQLGVIRSKGIINNRQHIFLLLSGRRHRADNGQVEGESSEAEKGHRSVSALLS